MGVVEAEFGNWSDQGTEWPGYYWIIMWMMFSPWMMENLDLGTEEKNEPDASVFSGIMQWGEAEGNTMDGMSLTGGIVIIHIIEASS